MPPRKLSQTKCMKCDHEVGHESRNVPRKEKILVVNPKNISKGFLSKEHKQRFLFVSDCHLDEIPDLSSKSKPKLEKSKTAKVIHKN